MCSEKIPNQINFLRNTKQTELDFGPVDQTGRSSDSQACWVAQQTDTSEGREFKQFRSSLNWNKSRPVHHFHIGKLPDSLFWLYEEEQ